MRLQKEQRITCTSAASPDFGKPLQAVLRGITAIPFEKNAEKRITDIQMSLVQPDE
jgi:hypothetical protein